MTLTSAHNPLLQSVRRAAVAGRATDDGLIVIEGPNLLAEANRSPWEVQRVFCTEAAAATHRDLLEATSAELILVSSRALQATSATESTQEILALLRPRVWTWPDLLTGTGPLLVVLDGIQDPGNAGMIARSAEAFGVSGIVFLDGCVRVSNGKFLRASAGSIFRLPFLEAVAPDRLIAEAVRNLQCVLYSLDMRRSVAIDSVDLRKASAIIVGSEGAGVSTQLLRASRPVSIPTRQVESLNAAVACSIALWEASRQRTGV